MPTFPELVRLEVEAARRAFPTPESAPEGWTHNQLAHYWLGVILEEYVEFENEVFSRDFNFLDARAELAQIAAMCQRAAESLDLVDRCVEGGL